MKTKILHGDCLDLMRSMPDDSVDLVFCSPPYEDARTYGIDYRLKGQDWINWCVPRYQECVRVCRGLVAWVVEGRTRNFQYSSAPLLLMAELHNHGIKLRKPPIYHRIGIPGSGGPDWLRNDYEFVVAASKGKLPWSDNTAMGHPPKAAPGGAMSYRNTDGVRRNQQMAVATVKERRRAADGGIYNYGQPHEMRPNGERGVMRYVPPEKANPGNVISLGAVGGGNMGSKLCHENEAPFPERLAEFFVMSFCPPCGVVLDPFCGSGTTMAVAQRAGRKAIGIDVRESQVELSQRRIAESINSYSHVTQ